MEYKEVKDTILNIEGGFKVIKEVSIELYKSMDAVESKKLAFELYSSNAYQERSLAVFLLGYLSIDDLSCLLFLKDEVSKDDNWRVQEILAMAFDYFCSKTGYEKAIPYIEEWLHSPVANVRRAVSEGLRIWTSRPYFKEHPQKAVNYLSPLKDDESEYVRKSVGNALRDISKKHSQLIVNEIGSWDLDNRRIFQTYKLVIKNGLLAKKQ